MVEGLFDQCEPDHVHIVEVRANWLSVALAEQVLERVENLEGRVSLFLFECSYNANPSSHLGGSSRLSVGCSQGV